MHFVFGSYLILEICVPGFANMKTPRALHRVRVVKTLVPWSCCNEAATNLIKALGGEDVARRVVGGIKWWQVRAVNGLVVIILFCVGLALLLLVLL